MYVRVTIELFRLLYKKTSIVETSHNNCKYCSLEKHGADDNGKGPVAEIFRLSTTDTSETELICGNFFFYNWRDI